VGEEEEKKGVKKKRKKECSGKTLPHLFIPLWNGSCVETDIT